MQLNWFFNLFFCFFLPTFHEKIKSLKNCPNDFQKSLHSHSTPEKAPCVRNGIKIIWLGCEKLEQNYAEKCQRTAIFRLFRFSQKRSIRFEKKFLQSFYTMFESYMCNGITIVWLGCKKLCNVQQPMTKFRCKIRYMRYQKLSQKDDQKSKKGTKNGERLPSERLKRE